MSPTSTSTGSIPNLLVSCVRTGSSLRTRNEPILRRNPGEVNEGPNLSFPVFVDVVVVLLLGEAYDSEYSSASSSPDRHQWYQHQRPHSCFSDVLQWPACLQHHRIAFLDNDPTTNCGLMWRRAKAIFASVPTFSSLVITARYSA